MKQVSNRPPSLNYGPMAHHPNDVVGSSRLVHLLQLAAGVALALLLLLLQPSNAQAFCGGFTSVNSTTSLNDAIADFNGQAGPGCAYGIVLSTSISLTANISNVHNSNAGVTLAIDGAGHTVDGVAQTFDTFVILTDTIVSMVAISVTESSDDGLDNSGQTTLSASVFSNNGEDGVQNRGVITITNTTSRDNEYGFYNYEQGVMKVSNSRAADNDEDGFDSDDQAVATVVNSTASGNDDGFDNTADGVITIISSTVTGNVSYGIVNSQGGMITVISSTVTDNGDDGIDNDDDGLVTVDASTVADNGSDGIKNSNVMTVTNSTISDNNRGIYGASGALQIVNSSVISNAGGGLLSDGAAMTITNSIVANSGANPDCDNNGGTVVVRYTLVVSPGGGNTCGVSDGVDGNIVGQAAEVGPLQDNGGPTFTHALLPNSPARDAGDNAAANAAGLAYDQRGAGFSRLSLEKVDMGAYEIQCAPFPRNVGNTAELNEAIRCYNGITSAAAYSVTLSNSIVLTEDIAAVDNSNTGVALSIDGGGHSVSGDGQTYDMFVVMSGTVVSLKAISVTQGVDDGLDNDGIMTVSRSVFSGHDDDGIQNGGVMTITNTTSKANDYGLYNSSGVVTVTGSTFSDNGSDGLYNSDGVMTVVNSTVSDSGETAIDNDDQMFLINSTVNENKDFGIENAGAITVTNSIVANTASGKDCENDGGTVDIRYTLVESNAGPNPCGVSDGVNDNIVGKDPQLGPLQNNGGPTFTHALLEGSPAINAGDNALAKDAAGNPLTTDQRGAGYPRIVQGKVDMGAYELFLTYDIYLPLIVR